MPIIYQSRIIRADLKRNPNVFYVFGDNVEGWGKKGQAAEMRGEPNAIGVPTKWKPSMAEDAFFYDHQIDQARKLMEPSLHLISKNLNNKKIVIWPADGIGTGYSRLPHTAPKLWAELEQIRKYLETL